MPTLSPAVLQDFATRLLAAGGMTAAEAEVTAASLVGANLRGYDSHGVMRIPNYVQAIAVGDMASQGKLEILDEGPSRIVANANWGVGQVQATALLYKLIAKTEQSGLAVATMTQCGHIGRLGEYCELAAARGLVSMLMVNSHGAGAGRPAGRQAAAALHQSTRDGSAARRYAARARFQHQRHSGRQSTREEDRWRAVPEGWLLDSEGRPTTDPNSLYGNPPGSILPMGGPGQTYKGFGLGLMVEIFTGALSGGICARPIPYAKNGNCVFMMVIDPARFGGRDCFAAEVKQLTEYVRSCPTVEGCTEILLPGDPERRRLAKNSAGITFDPENFAALVKLAEKLKVAVPI